MELLGNHEPNNLIAFADALRVSIQLACPQTKDRSAEMPFALSLSHLQQFCFVLPLHKMQGSLSTSGRVKDHHLIT
jgi:hypothetical protein